MNAKAWTKPYTDESEDLGNRFMAYKSTIDQLSSWWVKKIFFTKLLIISGLCLSAGILGVFINGGVVVIMSLAALFSSLTAHRLLCSHEKHRREACEMFTEESMALIKNLKGSENLYKEAKEVIHLNINKQKICNKKIEEEITFLDFKKQSFNMKREDLIAIMENCKKETVKLIDEEKRIKDSFIAIKEKQNLLITKLENDLKYNEAGYQFSRNVAKKASSSGENCFTLFSSQNKSGKSTQTPWVEKLEKLGNQTIKENEQIKNNENFKQIC